MEKKVNIGLTDKTHAQAKILATIKKTSLAKYLEEAINKAVEEDKELLKRILE